MTDPAAPPPLSEFLINYPLFDQAAGQELADLAEAVKTIDRKGSLVLKLGVEKTGTRVLVHVSTEMKAPKPDPEAGLFYAGPAGLSKDDPTQVRFDFATGEVIVPDAPKE